MSVLYTNNATTTLSASITNSTTSLSVASGTGSLFPAITGSDFFFVTISNSAGTNEIVKVTARSVDTLTIVRAQDGTSAAAWSAGDKVELRITKAMLDQLKADITNNYTLPVATTSVFGGVRLATDYRLNLTPNDLFETEGKVYKIQMNDAGQLVVCVPWDGGTGGGTYYAGTGLTLTAGYFAANFGTDMNTICQGNDSRLSDARTPTTHDNTKHSVAYEASGTAATLLSTHTTKYDHTKIHAPLTITGNGLVLNAQQLNLSIGTGSTQVAAGNHTHIASDVGAYTISQVDSLLSAKLYNPTNATGDILYRDSYGVVTRLGIGTTGQVLTVAGGIPSWATPATSNTSVPTSSDLTYAKLSGYLPSEVAGQSLGLTSDFACPLPSDVLVVFIFGEFSSSPPTNPATLYIPGKGTLYPDVHMQTDDGIGIFRMVWGFKIPGIIVSGDVALATYSMPNSAISLAFSALAAKGVMGAVEPVSAGVPGGTQIDTFFHTSSMYVPTDISTTKNGGKLIAVASSWSWSPPSPTTMNGVVDYYMSSNVGGVAGGIYTMPSSWSGGTALSFNTSCNVVGCCIFSRELA